MLLLSQVLKDKLLRIPGLCALGGAPIANHGLRANLGGYLTRCW
jgi:hypothetical protein